MKKSILMDFVHELLDFETFMNAYNESQVQGKKTLFSQVLGEIMGQDIVVTVVCKPTK